MLPGNSESIRRYDSDTALNYSINRYEAGGAKAMGYNWADGGAITGLSRAGCRLTLPSTVYFCFGNLSGPTDSMRSRTHPWAGLPAAREVGFN